MYYNHLSTNIDIISVSAEYNRKGFAGSSNKDNALSIISKLLPAFHFQIQFKRININSKNTYKFKIYQKLPFNVLWNIFYLKVKKSNWVPFDHYKTTREITYI